MRELSLTMIQRIRLLLFLRSSGAELRYAERKPLTSARRKIELIPEDEASLLRETSDGRTFIDLKTASEKPPITVVLTKDEVARTYAALQEGKFSSLDDDWVEPVVDQLEEPRKAVEG